jgi:flagellar protein FlaG
MSAETFTTAMFLITAVIAAGVLINAVFPVVYTMAGTFQSSTHESDQRLRTDFKIVAAFNASGGYDVYMKNIGSQPVPITDIQRSDVFCGPVGTINRDTGWEYDFTPLEYDLNNNKYWDPGETLKVSATRSIKGIPIYFQFILPNGIWRSIEFT